MILSLNCSTDGSVTFVSELSSKPAQKLSKYSWYGNVRLQRFHVPEETAIARWLFSITKGNNFYCGQGNVSMCAGRSQNVESSHSCQIFPSF